MIKFYHIIATTYHNNTDIGSHYYSIATDKELLPKEVKLTWDNISEFYEFNGPYCKFNIWNFKKGRLVSFFSNKLFPIRGDFADVKEWKHKDLNITISYEYKEYVPTLNEVFDWHDTNTAIQWLKEHEIELLKEI